MEDVQDLNRSHFIGAQNSSEVKLDGANSLGTESEVIVCGQGEPFNGFVSCERRSLARVVDVSCIAYPVVADRQAVVGAGARLSVPKRSVDLIVEIGEIDASIMTAGKCDMLQASGYSWLIRHEHAPATRCFGAAARAPALCVTVA